MRSSSAATCLVLVASCLPPGTHEAAGADAGQTSNGSGTRQTSGGGAGGACEPVSHGNCPGQVAVNQGLLAGGSAGDAMAASAFFSFGPRVVLAGTGCALLDGPGMAQGTTNTEAATIRLDLAAGLGPGSYTYSADGGSPFTAAYAFSSPYYGGNISAPLSGTLTLTRVDPTQGVEGCYHFDFGGSGMSGGGCGPSGCVSGSLGELVEDGTFVAPVCDICGTEP